MKKGVLIIVLIIGILIGFSIGYLVQNNKINEYKNEVEEQIKISQEYFNLLKSGNQICTIPSPLDCEEFLIEKNKIQIVIRNGVGKDLSAVTLRVENCGETDTNSIKAGETTTFEIPCITNKPYVYKEVFVDYEGKTSKGYIYSIVK